MSGGRRSGAGAVAAIGFGTTVAMWAAGYASRLPRPPLPSPAVLVAMLAAMTAGAAVAGRFAERPVRTGALAGLLTAALNLLILGSLLGEGAAGRFGLAAAAVSALAFGAAWGAGGAALFGRWLGRSGASPDWVHAMAWVAAAAAFLLVVAGGLVTSHDAGLAVPDWPNT
ncbi:MAG: hypothetical protein D6718_08670, partial [Acidobacteria bacterium]